MADREKVEKALDCRADGFGLDCKDCSYYREDTPAYCDSRQILRDAIAIMKEQDETIKELQNAYGYLQKQFFEVQDKLLKEQEKLINIDELREKLGFSDNCENCKQNARYCQYDSHFALMDFCERLDMAIEDLMTEGR